MFIQKNFAYTDHTILSRIVRSSKTSSSLCYLSYINSAARPKLSFYFKRSGGPRKLINELRGSYCMTITIGQITFMYYIRTKVYNMLSVEKRLTIYRKHQMGQLLD